MSPKKMVPRSATGMPRTTEKRLVCTCSQPWTTKQGDT